MEKINLTKSDADYYRASKKPRVLDLADKSYISIKGVGAPEGDKFQHSITAIYAVAYVLKNKYKSNHQDFVVPKMEAFWWVEDEQDFEKVAREEWLWEILIRMPEFVQPKTVEQAIQTVIEKKGTALANEVYFKTISAQKCVQALHLGSYEEEQPTIQGIFAFMKENNLEMAGYHREIYVSDPRKTPTERLKTILRYQVK